MPVFVDTNGLVFRFDLTEPGKQRRAEVWLDHLWSWGTGRVSVQVLQELYASLTRKLDHPMDAAEKLAGRLRVLFQPGAKRTGQSEGDRSWGSCTRGLVRSPSSSCPAAPSDGLRFS